jgi:hypothetical protein
VGAPGATFTTVICHMSQTHLRTTLTLACHFIECICICSHGFRQVRVAPLPAFIVLPSFLALKTTMQKLLELDFTSLPRARLSRHPFSIQNTHHTSISSHHPPILSCLKTTALKPSELDFTSLPRARLSRHPFSIEHAHPAPQVLPALLPLQDHPVD